MPLKIPIKSILFTISFVVLASCDDGYDLGKYQELKENGELEDVVHEWMHAYIERYCRVDSDQSITCE